MTNGSGEPAMDDAEQRENGYDAQAAARSHGGHQDDGAPTGGGGMGDDGEGRVHPFWRTLAGTLAGLLAGGFGSWLMFDRDQPTRAEVRELVEAQVRPVVTQLQTTTDRFEKLADEQAGMSREFNRLLGRLETMVGEGKAR